MMKNRIIQIISIVLLVFVFTACEEYLDKTPDATAFTEEKVFTNYENSQKFIDQLLIESFWDANPWNKLRWSKQKQNGFPLQMNGSRDRISDDCLPATNLPGERMWNIRRGDFLASERDQDFRWQPNQFRRWDVKWRAIRIANLSITNIERLEDATDEQKANILGMAYFFKAHFYFQITQNWGGMPWIDKPLDPSIDLDLERDDYKTTMQNIAKSFDEAAKYLPMVVSEAEWGRPSKMAALAYKAKALLWAASPFANPGNDQQLWEDAAVAAGEAILAAESSGYYKLIDMDDWRDLYHGCTEETFKEVFYGLYMDDADWIRNLPQWRYSGIPSKGFGSGAAAESSMENLAKCFAWSNGDEINQSSLEYRTKPFFGDSTPSGHSGRDPRFYQTFVFNGQDNPISQKLEQRKVQIWHESYAGDSDKSLDMPVSDGVVPTKYTVTGYYNWKLKADANYINKAKSRQLFNYIRFADLYLFYAEAANRAWGPTGAPQGVPGLTMNAVDAINEVRIRAKMPIFDNSTPSLTVGSTEEFEEKIRNEVRVETAFEGKRFYHIRRWRIMTSPEVLNQYGLYIKKVGPEQFEYEVVKLDQAYQLTWDEKHYLFPVPNNDVFIGPKFVQNPGW